MSPPPAKKAGEGLPGEPILRLDPSMHTAKIEQIGVDAASHFLITGSLDKTVRVWSLADGKLLRTLRVPIGEGNVGMVCAVAIMPDGSRVAAGGWGPRERDNSVYLFERATGRLVARVNGLPDVINHLTFSSDGRYLVATLHGANGIRVFETTGFEQVAKHRRYKAASYWAAFDAAGRLATTSDDGQVRLYDAQFRPIESRKAPGGERPYGIAFSPDGTRIAVGYADNTQVDVLDGQTLAPLFAPDTADVDNGNLIHVAWSADGQLLYAGGRYQEASGRLVWSADGQLLYAGARHPERIGRVLVRRWADGGRGTYQDIALAGDAITDLCPLADERLAFGAADPALGLLGSDSAVLWRQDPVQADFRDQEDKVALSADGTSIAFGFKQWGESLARFDLAARRLTLDPQPNPALAFARTKAPDLVVEAWKSRCDPKLNGKPLPLYGYETSRSLAVAPDGRRFLLGAEWSLYLFDRTGKKLWRVLAPGTVWAVNVSGDGRLALAAFGDGTIRWYRLADGKELLAFFPHRDQERWVAWTPQGYYMASPGGEDLIGWHINRGLEREPEFHTIARFRDVFHRPDVVTLVLEELDLEKALAHADREAGIGAAAVKTPAEIARDLPVIEIIEPVDGAEVASDDVQLTYLISAPVGAPVPRVSAHLNGQLVQTVAGPPIPVPPAGHRGRIVVPLAGWLQSEEAVVTLVAEGPRASDPVQVRLRWISGAIEAQLARPTLFVLAVGISKYARNPPKNLTYAAKDAADIAGALLRQKGGLYSEVKVRALPDEDATASEIIAGLRWLREQVKERDVVIVFLSGHGEFKEVYYFLPHDVDVRTQDDLAVTAIGQDQLRGALRVLYRNGAKVLAFFDTCHSGAFGPTKDLPPDMDRLAAELKNPENGVIVFTSSTGRELSREDPTWENGAFTEALLEAFAGKADRSGQGVLRVSDLHAYVPGRVRELTDGEQNPRIYAPFEELWNAPIAVVR